MNTKHLLSLLLLGLLCAGPALVALDRKKPQLMTQITKPLPEEIPRFISEQYPGATILWFKKEETGYEVGIQDEGIKKKIRFGKEYLWLTTVWKINPADVPGNILYALDDAAYPSSGIVEAAVTETPEGLFYALRLRQSGNEVELTVDGLGKIIR